MVEDGNKYRHRHLATVSFEHQTSFQFFDDDSVDDVREDTESDNEGESEDEEAWYQDYPCCDMGCQTRGLPCITAMLEEMKRPWMQEDENEPTALQEDPTPVPPPVCGSADETGACNSMCRLANMSRGRFRRAESSRRLAKRDPETEIEF